MKLLKIVTFICLTVIIHAEWISLQDGTADAKFSTLRSNQNEQMIEFQIGGFEVTTEERDGKSFSKISHPANNAGLTLDFGKPQVPVFSTFIAVPSDVDVKIHIEEAEYEFLDGYRVFPAQPLPTESGKELLDFEFDQVIYASDDLFPEKSVYATEPVIFRDLRTVQIAVQPIQVNPHSDQLKIMQSAKIKIEFVEGSATNVLHSQAKKSKAFEPLHKSMILNYSDTQTGRDEDVFQDPCYLFIYPSSLASQISALEPLLEWKKEKGYEVHVVSTSETGSTTSAIKSYIQNAYNNWINPPEYVCFVGDAGGSYSIPTYSENMSGYYGEGDHPYSLLAGNDDISDILLGRISIRSISDLETVVHKILSYERSPYLAQTTWYSRALLVGDASTSGISCIITNQAIKEMMMGSISSFTEIYDSPFPSQMSAGLNQGVLYANYRGYWGVSGFDNGDINYLTNGYMLPFATFLTCGTGSFESDYACMSETFLRAGSVSNPKGAIAAVATATLGTHTMFNNCVDGGMYYGIFVEDIFTVGGAVVRGKTNLHINYPDNPHQYPEIFSHWNTLMGDPGMELWTGTPRALNVEYPATIPEGVQYLTVLVADQLGHPVADAWVTVYKNDDDARVFGYSGSNGIVYLPASEFTNGSASLTVTKHNRIPHLGSVEFIQGDSFVNYSDVIIHEIMGNDDGHINPGETIGLDVIMQNFGSENVTGISATLSSVDGKISIITGEVNYPDLSAGESSSGESNFTVVFDSDILGGEFAQVKLTVETVLGQSWTDYGWLSVSAPLIIVNSFDLTDESGGSFEPGENGSLVVNFENMGILAEDFEVEIKTSDDRIILSDSTAFLGLIESGGIVSNASDPLLFYANPAILPGSQIQFDLIITNASGYYSEIPVLLEIGEVSVYDPLGPDAYGYYCYDSNDFGYVSTPSYDWIEISGIGTNENITDGGNNQDESKTIEIPFTFRFYGLNYNKITICSNGWLSMGESEQASFRNWVLPGALGPNSMIAAFWDDLKTSSGAIYTYHDVNNHRFIIQWDNMITFYNGSPETFEVILYDSDYYETPTGDGEIVIQYRDFNNTTVGDYYGQIHGNYSTIGLEDHTSTVGLQYTFNNTYPTAAAVLHDGMAIKFTTAGNAILEPPIAVVDVEELEYALESGGISEESFTISNAGESNLVYSVQMVYDGFIGSHGPDNFGHFWGDSDEESELDYYWIDISQIGTELTFQHNDYAPEERFPIGFDFSFYGETYQEILVNPNGWIGFENDDSDYANTSLPNSNAPKSAIFGYWDDLNPVNNGNGNGSGTVLYHANSERCVIWFNNVIHYPGDFNGTYNFQIVLYPDDKFEVNYQSMSGHLNGATVGAQNQDASDAMLVSYNESYAHSNLTLHLDKSPNWLLFDGTSGVVESGSSENVYFSVDANILADGEYLGEIIVNTNDPQNQQITIPTVLTIGETCSGWNLGDINNDDFVNILDVILMINFVLQTEEPNECEFYVSDYNDDGVLNILDVIQLVNVILNG